MIYTVVESPSVNLPTAIFNLTWAKYGVNVTIAEAFTQEWVAGDLAADSTISVYVPRVFDAWITPKPYFDFDFTVMQSTDPPDCDHGDSKLVAEAVQRLHGVEAPDPFGGGPTVHHFFFDRDGHITHRTVRELEDHINGNLQVMGYKNRVTFDKKLLLCPSDITPDNLKKSERGDAFALDPRAPCLLSSTLFSYVFHEPANDFDRMVTKHVENQLSNDVEAIAAASRRLVLYGKKQPFLESIVLKKC